VIIPWVTANAVNRFGRVGNDTTSFQCLNSAAQPPVMCRHQELRKNTAKAVLKHISTDRVKRTDQMGALSGYGAEIGFDYACSRATAR
jgi:hypothetical protein